MCSSVSICFLYFSFDSFFCWLAFILFSLILFYHILSCCFLKVLLCFLLRETKKQCEIGWMGKIWEELGKQNHI